MFAIASQTITGSSTATIDFTNISQSFTHLQFRVTGYSTLAATVDNLAMFFNNDGGFNYATHFVNGNGASVTTGGFITSPRIYVPSLFPAATTAKFGTVIIDILDYKNTTKNKVVRMFNGWDNNGSGQVSLISGMWLSTAAINRMTFDCSAFFAAGTRIDVYGIATSNATGA
jgi:hypothetical protein